MDLFSNGPETIFGVILESKWSGVCKAEADCVDCLKVILTGV